MTRLAMPWMIAVARGRPAVGAQVEHGRPGHGAHRQRVHQQAAEHRPEGSAAVPQEAEHLLDRYRLRRRGLGRSSRGHCRAATAARRLQHRRQHQDREQEIRDGRDQEDHLPGTYRADDRQRQRRCRRQRLDQRRAHQQRDAGTIDEADVHHRHRARQLGRREVIGQDRIGRGSRAGTADPADQARDEQSAERRRQPGGEARAAQDHQADAEHQPAADRIDQARDGQRQQRVERGGREADDQAHLGVIEVQVAFDRVHQQVDDAGVAEHHQQHQREDRRRRTRRGAGPDRVRVLRARSRCAQYCPDGAGSVRP